MKVRYLPISNSKLGMNGSGAANSNSWNSCAVEFLIPSRNPAWVPVSFDLSVRRWQSKVVPVSRSSQPPNLLKLLLAHVQSTIFISAGLLLLPLVRNAPLLKSRLAFIIWVQLLPPIPYVKYFIGRQKSKRLMMPYRFCRSGNRCPLSRATPIPNDKHI